MHYEYDAWYGNKRTLKQKVINLLKNGDWISLRIGAEDGFLDSLCVSINDYKELIEYFFE